MITSVNPKVLTKAFKLGRDGKLEKKSIAHLSEGYANQVTVNSLAEFRELLESLESNNALTYGIVPGRKEARIVTRENAAEHPEAITRTKDYFGFAHRPGIMMLDYDPLPGQSLTPAELIDKIRGAAPCLAEVEMFWRPSVSSGICGSDGTQCTGISGQRIYIPVKDATSIPLAGEALVKLLWAKGEGWVAIGGAGQALMRTLVDSAVWGPERLDFAAPPILGQGLVRDPAPGFISGTPGQRLNARDLIDAVTPAIRARAKQQRDNAREAVQPLLKAARMKWVEENAPRIAAVRGQPVDEVRQYLAHAADERELTEEFVLFCQDGSRPTVGEMLANPTKWHGKRFADPFEPDYRGDDRIAWANLRGGGEPYLYSHAHGGQYYVLRRNRRRVLISTGQRPAAVDQTMEVLTQCGVLYDYGEGKLLARLGHQVKLIPVDEDWLLDQLDRLVDFRSERQQKEAVIEMPANAPSWLAKRINALNGERGLPWVDAVITAPTLRLDGSILAEPGYDATSRLLFISDRPEIPEIPEYPSLDEARQALTQFWTPFQDFPLVDAVDRGVTLAAYLTACIRGSLTTAPGFGFDAPTAGTGKTLLAQTIGALMLGHRPAVLAPADQRDDETRKRLFAALRDGTRVLLWDNLRDPLGNAGLDAFLTAPVFSDRVLGSSTTASLPNRALFLATGNNLRYVGDTCRRIFSARLDAQIEQPYAREFDLCPLAYTLTHRMALVVAGLTLMRAYIAAGKPKLGAGRTASFEDWDDLVRQTVCWVATWDKRFDDPLKATERTFEVDPETSKLTALLESWDMVFGNIAMTTGQVITQISASEILNPVLTPSLSALKEAVEEIALIGSRLNSRVLGRWIERNLDRRLNGLRLVRGHKVNGNQTWSVQRDKTPDRPPPQPTTPKRGRRKALSSGGTKVTP